MIKTISIILIVITALFLVTGFFAIFWEFLFPSPTRKIKPLMILKIIIGNIYGILFILIIHIITPLTIISIISYLTYRIIHQILIS